MGASVYANNATQAPASGAPQGGSGAVARAVPFARGAYKSRQAVAAQAVTLSAAVQNMSFVIPAVGGWNRRIALRVACVTAGNAAGVTFAADGPYNAITTILLKDSAQKQLNLFSNGYHAFLMNNFGGYKPFKLEGSSRGFLATTGAGATGGSFTFYINLPQECARDGFASYPNMDASQRLTLDLTINANANIYGVAPTTPGTLTITPVVWYYAKPAAVNAKGRAQETVPPAAGSVQFWRTINQVIASGDNIVTVNLSGRYIRNCFAIFTDGSDVRSDTVRPTTMRVEIDNNLLYDAPTADWDEDIYRTFQQDTPTGFYPLIIGTADPDGIAMAEWGDDWIETSTSSQMVLKFNAGASGKLYLLMNEVELQGEFLR